MTGIDWTFAPTVAVVRDGRWGRAYEGYSDRPISFAPTPAAWSREFKARRERPSFLDTNHILATAKHFIGDGGTDRGIDRGDNLSSEQELLDIHGQGYITALEAGVQTVMVSYNSWQGPKLHGQHYLHHRCAQERAWVSMGGGERLERHRRGAGLLGGCLCPGRQRRNRPVHGARKPGRHSFEHRRAGAGGDIPESRIDDAVTRILRVKLRAGLFEKGRPSSRPLANKRALLGAPEHRAVAREAVRKSLVLLKNDGGLLPLRRKAHVLVAGDGADSIGKQTGGWTLTWQGTENSNAEFPGATSIFEGIRAAVNAAGGTATLSADGSYRSRPDVAIVVFGENPYAEWHGDIQSLDFQGADGNPAPDLSRPWPETPLPGQWAPPVAAAGPWVPAVDAAQKIPICSWFSACGISGIPVVTVFLTGRPRGITPELQASNAFVVAWLPGTEGDGIADVLFRNNKGAVNFDFTGQTVLYVAAGGARECRTAAIRRRSFPMVTA